MKKLLLIIAFAIFGLGLNAQSVYINYGDYSLEFSVTSVEPSECELSDYSGSPTDVVIPSSVEIEGIEHNVTSIGDDAFSYCSSLTSITFGENSQLTSIGNNAFSSCSSLTSIEIPSSVTSIGWSAFSYCSSLTSIVVEEGNTVYDSRDNCNAIIETATNTLVSGCQNTIIPNTVTSIGDMAFFYCSSLTSIEIPSSVTSIGGYAFAYCSSLTSIEIPSSVTSIGWSAFSYCSSLESLTFGENSQLTSIGYDAFSDCSSLTSIEIPSSVTSIGDRAFYACSSLTSIVVEEGNTVYDSRVNCNAIIETATNTLVSGCQNTIIPNTVTSIGDDAFFYCSSLESIEMPSSVTSIGDMAFRGCSSLTSIEIPSSVTSIGEMAFYGCSSLKTIVCYVENIPETGDNVFAGCPSNMIIYVPEVSLENYKATSPWNNFTIYSLEGPRNVTATAESISSVILTWDNCYADSYNIYRNGDLLTNVTETSYSDENLDSFTRYCYEVAVVRNETETEKSEEICATTFDLPITTPENLVATPTSTSSIELTWNEVENALSYNIYRNGDSITNVTTSTYTDNDLEYDTKYCYEITAVRNETETEESGVVCATTFDLPITTPENLVATPTSTSSIELTWSEVENALSYNIYRDGDSIANVTTATYTDYELEYDTEYCYEVTAVRGNEESDESNQECVKTLGEGVEELSSSFEIYPNPVENELFLATEVEVEEVSIYDIYGRLCRDASNASTSNASTSNASTSNSMDTFNVSVQNLDAGVYFINIKTKKGNVVKRFIKK